MYHLALIYPVHPAKCTIEILPITSQSLLLSSRLPDLHCLIPGARGDALAIGRPGYRSHAAGMAGIRVEEITISGIPDLYRFIITCRSDAPAIRRPCHRPNRCGIRLKGIEVNAIGRVPDLYRSIGTGRGNVFAVG